MKNININIERHVTHVSCLTSGDIIDIGTGLEQKLILAARVLRGSRVLVHYLMCGEIHSAEWGAKGTVWVLAR